MSEGRSVWLAEPVVTWIEENRHSHETPSKFLQRHIKENKNNPEGLDELHSKLDELHRILENDEDD